MSNSWKETTLGEVVEIFTGKKDVNQTVPNGEHIFFSCSPETFRSNDYICDNKAIIIVGNGSYTGTVRFFEGKFDLYQRTYACTLKNDTRFEFDIKFL
jgi:type I restriction enzyme S subunit